MKTAIVSLGTLLCLYVGSYSLLIKRECGSAMTTEGCVQFVYPSFRWGGKVAEWFYAPTLWADGQVRSRFWSGLDDVATSGSDSAVELAP